jgi:predicted transcriptional regulator
LANKAGISVPTIKRLEAAEGDIGGRVETGAALVAALEKAGVEFIAENGGGAGVRMKKRKR